jgi:hypothetical protein
MTALEVDWRDAHELRAVDCRHRHEDVEPVPPVAPVAPVTFGPASMVARAGSGRTCPQCHRGFHVPCTEPGPRLRPLNLPLENPENLDYGEHFGAIYREKVAAWRGEPA